MLKFAKRLFVYLTSHTYSNMSRLFLRLFIGVILMQLGVSQMTNFELYERIPETMGMSGGTFISVIIAVELVCSTLIILGLFTRFAVLPLLVIMSGAVYYVKEGLSSVTGDIFGMQPLMLPLLICGILLFFIIAGPGKISFDYVLARYMVSFDGPTDEEEKDLEEA